MVYLVIAFSHLRMRRTVEKTNPDALKVKMWLYPYLTYVTILGIVAVLVAMIFIDSLRPQVLLTLLIAALVVGSYFLLHPKKTSTLPLDSEDSSVKS